MQLTGPERARALRDRMPFPFVPRTHPGIDTAQREPAEVLAKPRIDDAAVAECRQGPLAT